MTDEVTPPGFIVDISFPEIEGSGLEEMIEDICGELEHYGSGTWMGSTPWQRDLEFWDSATSTVNHDELEKAIEAAFDKAVTDPELRARCSVSISDEEEGEEDEDG
jgi:hypothetical protein